MVRVGTRFVNGSAESFESFGEVAGEPNGHVRCSERGGQVRGIQQMLTDARDCRDVVTQIAAANKALEQVGFVLVAAGLTWCLEDPSRSADAGYDVADVQKMFLKLA
jgi:DNA-binding FrmR family transcriptional regulator